MKIPSTDGAVATRYLAQCLAEPFSDDETKLTFRHSLMIAMQLTASIGACGLVHWVMS